MHRVPGVILALSALSAVGGCTLFYPRFDAFASEQTNAAYKEVAELTAAVELGKYSDKASFDSAVDTYASIDGKLIAAKQRVATLPASGRLSRVARDLIIRQIEGCRTQVDGLSDTHKQDGVQPNSGATQSVLVSCNQAAQATDAMK